MIIKKSSGYIIIPLPKILQYDPWVIREALHNCIAHQDYELKGRINVVEKPDELIFTNVGSFIPGSVEAVIKLDAPPELYRNPFLARAMTNLNMIDTIGGGIKKMFQTQAKRFFPLPYYDLTQPDRVAVRIAGKILDENYTRILLTKTDLDLQTIILLDKVQRKIKITKEEHQHLRKQKLTDGRYPDIYVADHIASINGEKGKYIKDKGFDKKYFQDLIMAFIEKHGSATRDEINQLILDKLPEILTEKQKKKNINNMLTEMSKKLGLLKNTGSTKSSKWVLVNKK